eukprot:TRINITY_DN2560_c0_g1_i1.p1 TRINITY_DN2560_c0_g1~~TRINITY_DN2560_c0_g1_i1.p1  ORF type:complete len:160 (-),score=28.65 TRINITY_DN2560_c0_g1_i1:119-571(-)
MIPVRFLNGKLVRASQPYPSSELANYAVKLQMDNVTVKVRLSMSISGVYVLDKKDNTVYGFLPLDKVTDTCYYRNRYQITARDGMFMVCYTFKTKQAKRATNAMELILKYRLGSGSVVNRFRAPIQRTEENPQRVNEILNAVNEQLSSRG